MDALLSKVSKLLGVSLSTFDNTQVTTQASLSDEMKTFYSKYLIKNAKSVLVHDQFAQTHNIPKRGGKTIEFRKYSPFPKALTPLTEGVTPSGRSLDVSTITATVKQYGDYVELSDVLLLTAIDDNLLQATELLGDQAGLTLDTVTREVLNSATNVQYADGQVTARHMLVGGDANPDNNHYFTVDCVRRGVRGLKAGKAKKINGDFVTIIHTDVAYDLTGDPKWEDWHKYAKPEEMYRGEIGRLHGSRYIETDEAKVFHAEDLSEANRNLSYASHTGTTITINETLTADDQAAIVGRKILLDGFQNTVVSATSGTIVVSDAVAGSPSASDPIYPGEAGAKGRDVYSTLMLGANAYGTTKVEGGGLRMIVRQVGAGEDPLEQRATAGWKAIKTAEILVDDYILRIETASTFEAGAN